MAKCRVFVDTNVIIESFQAGCWTAVRGHFAVETVEKCIEEAMTGDRSSPRYVPVDSNVLSAGLAGRHSVAKIEIARLALDFPQSQGLDEGEMHLLACLHRLGPSSDVAVMLSTADKAAVVVAGLLGRIDSLVSLESLAQQSGVRRRQVESLAGWYRSRWLDDIKVSIRLGMIP